MPMRKVRDINFSNISECPDYLFNGIFIVISIPKLISRTIPAAIYRSDNGNKTIIPIEQETNPRSTTMMKPF
jgi:hypothetical protein